MIKLNKFLIVASLLVSCSGGDTQRANALLDEARSAVVQGEYDEARFLIDSLRRSYPNEIEVRRQALSFVDSLELSEAKEELSVADSIKTFKSFEVEDLKNEFVFEKNEKYQTQGYYVPKKFAGSKSGLSSFYEVEESGKLLEVTIDKQRKYTFEEISIDQYVDSSGDGIVACDDPVLMSCLRLSKAMKELSDITQYKEKMALKIRFYEKKIKEAR